MAQEEKLEEAKRLYETANADQKYVLERLFPELRESEDERIRRQTLKVLNYYKDEEKSEGRMSTEIDECIAWLEKQGEQKPAAWSEEDEMMLECTIDKISDLGTGEMCKEWLNSLRPQNRWKPSDAQMASITCAVRKMKESACYDSELVSLLNDLKKL